VKARESQYVVEWESRQLVLSCARCASWGLDGWRNDGERGQVGGWIVWRRDKRERHRRFRSKKKRKTKSTERGEAGQVRKLVRQRDEYKHENRLARSYPLILLSCITDPR
jgi:hypothetical protein